MYRAQRRPADVNEYVAARHSLKPEVLARTLLASRGDAIDERTMSKKADNVTAEAQAYKPVPFAKRHRISLEDATEILAKHGHDLKAADKEARRVAV
jgi:hypothetical protein